MTIDEIRRANAAAGKHFFSRESMRWFGSRVGSSVYSAGDLRGQFFVTSERDSSEAPGGGAWGGRRRYTVRRFDPRTFDIAVVGSFGEHATSAEARRRAMAAAAAEREARS